MSDIEFCLVCGVAPLALAGVATALWRSRSSAASSTAQTDVARIESQVVTLERRVLRLEAEVASLRRNAPAAVPSAAPGMPTLAATAETSRPVPAAEPAAGMSPFGAPEAAPPDGAFAAESEADAASAPMAGESTTGGATFARPATSSASATDGGADFDAEGVAPSAEPTVEHVGAGPEEAPSGPGDAVPPSGTPPTEPRPGATGKPKPDETWEQWLGVRGAAVAGAIALAVAAVYFFRYTLEHGLIPAWLRVAVGAAIGAGCIAAFELRLRQSNRVLGEYLAGAGVIILYLAFWSARNRYDLVPPVVGAVLLMAVTGTACAISYVRGAKPVGVLGLLGGMATPMLLSSGEDRPVALFTYLLVLDAAFLFVARRANQPWLGALAVAGTTLYQVGWFGERLDSSRAWIAAVVVVAFAAAFAGMKENRVLRAVASVVLPSAYALWFAVDPRIGDNLLPLAGMLILLAGASAFLAREPGQRWLAVATSSATLMIFTVRSVIDPLEKPTVAWQLSLMVLGVSAVHVALREIARRWPRHDEAAAPFSFEILAFGVTFFEMAFSMRGGDYHLAPHVVLLFGLSALASVEVLRRGREVAAPVVATFGALALGGAHARHAELSGYPPATLWLALGIAFVVGTHVAPAIRAARSEVALLAERGAALAALATLFHVAFVFGPLPTAAYAAVLGVLLLLLYAGANRSGEGGSLVAFVSITAITHLAHEARDATSTRGALATFVGMALVMAVSPFLAGPRLREDAMIYRAAAMAGPAALLPIVMRVDHHVHEGIRGVPPLVLAALGLVTFAVARKRLPAAHPTLRAATAWSAVATLALVSVAIPAQLEREWITVGWALQGAAVAALYRRFDHPGIRVYALGLFAFCFARLVLNAEVLRYHAPSGLPVLNWLLYTYLVPVAAFLFAAREFSLASGARPPEEAAKDKLRSAPGLLALAAIVLGFVWVNLTVIDAFASGRTLEIPVERKPARDLAISVAWAIYGVALLAVGMYKRNKPLRVTSLVLVLLTCAKVFLFDLGNLRDLYRVASLLGLALALIAVSAAYKRFVFREETER